MTPIAMPTMPTQVPMPCGLASLSSSKVITPLGSQGSPKAHDISACKLVRAKDTTHGAYDPHTARPLIAASPRMPVPSWRLAAGSVVGDRTYKLSSSTTSEYGRVLNPQGSPVAGSLRRLFNAPKRHPVPCRQLVFVCAKSIQLSLRRF